jgi:hypothetical protein
MLMTHGDAFRCRPALLPRLMCEGGLTEVSIHIDSTQRGRKGAAYRQATTEAELLPLRDEFARLIRRVRRETGRPLDVASTFTVTRDNLHEIPLVLRWMQSNADAFKMISFQPAAQVGRTRAELGGKVSVEELWAAIARSILGRRAEAAQLRAVEGWLGHPDCSRFVQGVVVSEPGREPIFHPLIADDPVEQEAVQALLPAIGGLTFRLDDRARAAARLLGLVARWPRLLAWHVPRLVMRWARRLSPEGPGRLAWRWLRGDVRFHYLNVVSHHFMSADELRSASGRERAALCVFQVPVGDRLVSMCEANALGIRDRYYEALAGADRSRAQGEPAASGARSDPLVATASAQYGVAERLDLVREQHQPFAAVELDGEQTATDVVA